MKGKREEEGDQRGPGKRQKGWTAENTGKESAKEKTRNTTEIEFKETETKKD